MEGGTGKVTIETLQRLVDAFNAHDVDAVMAFSSTTGPGAARGPDPWGRRFRGGRPSERGWPVLRRHPRRPLRRRPSLGERRRGCSEWLLTGTTPRGSGSRCAAATCSSSRATKSPGRTLLEARRAVTRCHARLGVALWVLEGTVEPCHVSLRIGHWKWSSWSDPLRRSGGRAIWQLHQRVINASHMAPSPMATGCWAHERVWTRDGSGGLPPWAMPPPGPSGGQYRERAAAAPVRGSRPGVAARDVRGVLRTAWSDALRDWEYVEDGAGPCGTCQACKQLPTTQIFPLPRGRAPDERKLCRIRGGSRPAPRLPLGIVRDRMGVPEPQPGSAPSGCPAATRSMPTRRSSAGPRSSANSMARSSDGIGTRRPAWRVRRRGLERLRRYHLVGSPHHVIRPLGVSGDINGVLAVEYVSGEEFSHAIARATRYGDDAHSIGG